MKRCLGSLIVWEMEIKNTMKYHLAPVRMAIKKKKKTNDRYWPVYKEKPCALLIGM